MAQKFSTRFSLPTFVKRVDELTQNQKNAISRTGFGNLLLIGNHRISKNLLVELMERWYPQSNAFVLAKGEIKITPLDVALILGLPVVGPPVDIVRELDVPYLELERHYGVNLWDRKITLASIIERLDKLGEIDDDDFVRTFLLFTFATILFPNSNATIDSRYLSLLQDLDIVGKLAWGVVVLDDLVSWLTKRKTSNVQYVGGCLILLQIWFYEHVDVARPSLRNHPIKFPRACRWDNSKSRERDWYGLQLRNLQSNQVSYFLDLTLEELETEIVNEFLASQREMGTTPTDHNSQAGGAFETVSSSDVSDNQGHDVLANVRTCQQVSTKGSTIQLSSSCDSPFTSMRNQQSSRPASNFIYISDASDNQGVGVSVNYGCSNQRSICDLSSSSSGCRFSSPQASCSPQVILRLNFVDLSSDDNEDESTSEDCLMKHEISKLRMEIAELRVENNDLKKEIEEEKDRKLSESVKIEEENKELRKEVEGLKHQNQLHVSALTRAKSIVFSKTADEVLGTTNL